MPRRKRINYKYGGGNPYQPDWRSIRAAYLVQSLPQSSKYCSKKAEGGAVTRMYHFLKNKGNATRETANANFIQIYADIIDATTIHTENCHAEFELRLRLCADQSPELISTIMKFEAKSILAYSIYYFDIRGASEKRLFVSTLGTMTSLSEQRICVTPEKDLERFCYIYVCTRGGATLDMVLDSYRNFGEKHDLSTVIGRTRAYFEISLMSWLLKVSNSPKHALQSIKVQSAVCKLEARSKKTFFVDLQNQSKPKFDSTRTASETTPPVDVDTPPTIPKGRTQPKPSSLREKRCQQYTTFANQHV
jgi:hypothetical protein